MPNAADCLPYAEAIFRHKPAFAPALRELLRLEVSDMTAFYKRQLGIAHQSLSSFKSMTSHAS